MCLSVYELELSCQEIAAARRQRAERDRLAHEIRPTRQPRRSAIGAAWRMLAQRPAPMVSGPRTRGSTAALS